MTQNPLKSPVAALIALACLLPSVSLSAQEEIVETSKEPTQEEQILQSMGNMLRRAELIRLLSAEHLNYLDSQSATADVRLIEDGSEVMAYSLICSDDAVKPRILNKIAAEATLKIALKVEDSPIKDRMTEAMGEMHPQDRMTLVADIASTVLMFKIGRRRGLFDALLTDFGTNRFCKGMGAGIRKRYNNLAVYLDDKQ